MDKTDAMLTGVAVVSAAVLAWVFAPDLMANARAPANPMAAGAEAAHDQMVRKAAVTRRPGESSLDAEARVGRDYARRAVNSAGNRDEAAERAAMVFYGFWMVNVRARTTYCDRYGVDISNFIETFSDNHSAEQSRAREIMARAGQSEDVVWASLKPQLMGMIERDMAQIAKLTGASDGSSACRTVNQQAAMVNSQLSFSSRAPEVHAALMN